MPNASFCGTFGRLQPFPQTSSNSNLARRLHSPVFGREHDCLPRVCSFPSSLATTPTTFKALAPKPIKDEASHCLQASHLSLGESYTVPAEQPGPMIIMLASTLHAWRLSPRILPPRRHLPATSLQMSRRPTTDRFVYSIATYNCACMCSGSH
jgi:hypothetical protein